MFSQMTTLSNVIVRVLIAAIMSLITGTIFWDLPSTDAKVRLKLCFIPLGIRIMGNQITQQIPLSPEIKNVLYFSSLSS